jgi:hypothetical protein
MMVIDEKFSIGSIVYIKTDVEQRPGIVTGISVRPGHLAYVVTSHDESAVFYDIELSSEKNVSINI